jgi:hypothetical protein
MEGILNTSNDYGLLRCDAMLSDRFVPALRRSLVFILRAEETPPESWNLSTIQNGVISEKRVILISTVVSQIARYK